MDQKIVGRTLHLILLHACIASHVLLLFLDFMNMLTLIVDFMKHKEHIRLIYIIVEKKTHGESSIGL